MAAMTALKGIGPWTAEVYLLFCVGHPDIFPAGDLALQVGVEKGLKLRKRPDEKSLASSRKSGRRIAASRRGCSGPIIACAATPQRRSAPKLGSR